VPERVALQRISTPDTKMFNRSVVVKSFADAKEFGVYALGFALIRQRISRYVRASAD
jgi:hypothetical protein